MISIDFVKKVSQCNKSIPFKDLLQAYKSYPIINPNNLNLILTDNQIKEFSDAESLIIYIEKKSRALDVKQAKINRDKRQKELDDLMDSYSKRMLEDLNLKKAASKALGLKLNAEQTCRACGYLPTASGNCNC